MRFIADQKRMLLLALIEPHDRVADLPHQIATKVRGFEIEGQGNLAQQVERRAGGEMNIEGLKETWDSAKR